MGERPDDVARIRGHVRSYATAVDRQDLEAVAACFTADCAYEGALGRGTIADALAALAGAFARYAHTEHVMETPEVRLAGATAVAETACTAHHVRHDGTRFTVGVRYRDELVRRGGGWLIARRTVRTEWTREETPGAG